MDYTTFQWVAFAAVLSFGVARFGRLVVHDEYPPSEWLRERWLVLVGDKWGKLLTCPWCFNPYAAAGSLAWWWFSDGHWTWWFFWGWLAVSQVSSTILMYDEPE